MREFINRMLKDETIETKEKIWLLRDWKAKVEEKIENSVLHADDLCSLVDAKNYIQKKLQRYGRKEV